MCHRPTELRSQVYGSAALVLATAGRADDQQGDIQADDREREDRRENPRAVEEPSHELVVPARVARVVGLLQAPGTLEPTRPSEPHLYRDRRVGDHGARNGDERRSAAPAL